MMTHEKFVWAINDMMEQCNTALARAEKAEKVIRELAERMVCPCISGMCNQCRTNTGSHSGDCEWCDNSRPA